MTADDLPEEGPTEKVDVNLEDQDAVFQHLCSVIDNWLIMEQLNGTVPMVAASKLFQVLVDVLQLGMGRSAVRMALLTVHEKTYEEPTTFIERGQIRDFINQISNARRKVEGRPSLILPGDPT